MDRAGKSMYENYFHTCTVQYMYNIIMCGWYMYVNTVMYNVHVCICMCVYVYVVYACVC